MASLAKRRAENVPGDVYVDTTCIDCDTCRWLAPGTFDRAGEMSRVHAQPGDAEALHRALMAVVACPTASIGTTERHDMKPALAAFPEPIEDGVHYCGFHSADSFGGTSYLIVREAGNVLVDSPRFNGPLVRRLEELGGVATMFLSHIDDVADHARFAAHFGCERILHRADVTADTRDVERQLAGADPIRLDDELLAIPAPGHTRGSTCLLYRDRFLFSGDHLMYSERLGHLVAPRHYSRDWERLRRSVEALLAHRFEWILPGHGRRAHYPAAQVPDELRRCLAWMDSLD